MVSTAMTTAALAAASVAVALASFSSDASASGLFVSDRGVRPMGRAGAFVAGADDLNAIYYNPAGIFDAGSQFLLDAAYINYDADYTRVALLRQVDPNTGETVGTYKQTFPTVSATVPFLPIPTIVGSFSPHPDWMLAFGAYAPYSVIPTFPSTVDGKAAPQRYSIESLDGSILAVVGAWASWAPLKKKAPQNLRIGFGLEFLVGQFSAETTMSGCLPERFFCSPEDPNWDVKAQIKAAPIITPSGIVGAQWEFAKGWRLGSSFHLPFFVRAPATVTTRLPSAPVFDKSTQEGDGATISFNLPFVLRLGLESRDLTPGLRIELAGSYEEWAMQDEIHVAPDEIAITNLPGFPKNYYIPDVHIPRHLQNSAGVHLGGEYAIKASEKVNVTPRVGVSFDSSAVPSAYESALFIDSNKLTPTVGLSVEIGHVRLDALYAHVFAQTVDVAPSEARLEQVLPLAATPPKNPDYVNAGVYSWSANVFGIGFAYTFGHPKDAPAAEPKSSDPKKGDPSLPTTEEDGKPKPTEPAKSESK